MKPKVHWKHLLSLPALGILAIGGVISVRGQEPDPQPIGGLQPQVLFAERFDQSPPLREMAALQPEAAPVGGEIPLLPLPKAAGPFPAEPSYVDPVLQQTSDEAMQQPSMPGAQFNFEGVSNADNSSKVLPPDPNGDIGPNHYVQWVNLSMAIWEIDRATQTATLVYGPQPGNAVWAGFGGLCETTNDGDPIVLYDHLADRWLISQFSISSTYYECVAVSKTGDPTGGWYRYAFRANGNKMNDYPKFGVWPDAYYMTANQFVNGSLWGGAGVWAFEREKMLQGIREARMIYFDLYAANPNFGGMLPADLDGPPPPAGTPNYFAEIDDKKWLGPADALRIWEFYVDWANPDNSSFGNNLQPNWILNVAPFNPQCGYPEPKFCVPQPGTSQGLDAISDRLMHRLQYRNFGSYSTLVTNHTVDIGDEAGRTGIRWYELRNNGAGWSIFQQDTFAGGAPNGEHRWMASAAMDGDGNIAIGYSVSSATVYPSIRYAGRLKDDPLHTLPRAEASLMEGKGSQLSQSGRWGDYSMLGVDPLDDCTFWYTQEYYAVTNQFSPWRTRIGSFSFPSCQTAPAGDLQGRVYDAASQVALGGASISAGTYNTLSAADGTYQIADLPAGTYTVTASLYGYQTVSEPGIQINNNASTTQDFALDRLPMATVRGTVKDGSGHGWPLYARLVISAPGFAQTVFTDPEDGSYQVQLAGGVAHTFAVQAMLSGYLARHPVVTPNIPETVRDFTLLVNETACDAPGYQLAAGCLAIPGGLLVGNVYDANSGAGIIGATIASDQRPEEATQSQSNPEDPNVDDGFYILFSSQTGMQPFTASEAFYQDDMQQAEVITDGVALSDFHLPAGRLLIYPTTLSATQAPTETITYTLLVTNTGGAPASFSLSEVNVLAAAAAPNGPYAPATRRVSPKRLNDLDASAVYIYRPPETKTLEGGDLLRSWHSGLSHPWGIAVNPLTGDLWVGDVSAAGGDDIAHRFTPAGQVTGDTLSLIDPQRPIIFPADLVYDPFSATLWQANVGGEPCVVEISPQLGRPSGQVICPPIAHGQRGLAFNPYDSTFFSGSWTDGILHQFNAAGSPLRSVNLAMNISGLAFNPDTGHLFVLSNADQGFDVYVLDGESLTILGGFDVSGLEDFQQAGMEIDCQGHLWIINQVSGEVLEVDSGERSACAWADVPWLEISPSAGNLAPGEWLSINLVLDASLANGLSNTAQVVLVNDTPYGSITIPISLLLPEAKSFIPFISR